MPGLGAPGSPGLSQELKVVVEPVERWDVARRPNWVEREERLEAQVPHHEEDGIGLVTSSGSTGVSLGTVVKEGMTTEEMQRWFMSNAEVQMHQTRPVPIWAKSKVFAMSLVKHSIFPSPVLFLFTNATFLVVSFLLLGLGSVYNLYNAYKYLNVLGLILS
jgi:hypothetical protein